jgi:hypothetical protein
MNCQNHPDTPASAYCRQCGKPLCAECQRSVSGTIFCAEHLPAPATAASQAAGAADPRGEGYHGTEGSPALAFLLGFIPGVGAIYNGQYAKGLIHAVIFGILVSLLDSPRFLSYQHAPPEVLIAMLLVAWIFYMPFEAYHTAVKRRLHQPVDEYSSLVDLSPGAPARRSPVGPIVLIALGVLLLLNTLDLINFESIARFWPVLLIAAGVYMLYVRIVEKQSPDDREANRER